MTDAGKRGVGLDSRGAELLARQFNTAFTTASGYGTTHPMFTKACEALHVSLEAALDHSEMLNLLLDRGALFVDKHAVGQRFNPRRLINLLAQLKIESISFSRGTTEADIEHLLALLADPTEYPQESAVSEALHAQGVTTIRLNYIVYRQVTADQKVVGQEAPEQAADDQAASSLPPEGASPADTFASIASLLSLDELVKDPDHYAERVQEQNSDDFRRRQLVRQLRNLISQVERGEIRGASAMSSEVVLGAVNNLRARVRQDLDTRRDVELILSEENQVLGEIDQLTYSTLVSLVREEFRGGRFSAKRMAQIINRMLPDARDLKRLLPQLKQGLMAEGMTVAEYGKLVHELSSELRGEHLVKALEAGADSVGLDVDEIVDQIREDPAEAARLIVMATELRRSGASDEDQLSAAFSDYIERISEKLYLDLGRGTTDAAGNPALDSQLMRVKQLLVDQLNQQGLPPELVEELRAKMNQARSEQGEKVEKVETTEAVAEPAGADNEPDDNRESLRPALPSRVLNPTNTAFFLNREIKSSQRYRTPFSVIKVSVELVRDRPSKPRRPEIRDLAELLPQVYAELIAQLRDLDLIGSLDKKQQAVPLMILPMTGSDGAEIVRKRLSRRLGHTPFRLSGSPAQILCAVTAESFDMENGESGQTFIQRIHERHRSSRDSLRQAAQA